jgi:PAS domain S-box-containing protein
MSSRMKNRALQYTLAFLIIGSILTLLIAYVQRKDYSGYRQNFLLVKLTDNLKYRASNASLGFEQLINGDRSKDFNRDVNNRIGSARNILQGVYDGADTELGHFEKSSDENTQALIKEATQNADKLSEAAGEKWKFLSDTTFAKSGMSRAEVDEKFNSSFQKFQSSLDKLAAHLDKDIKEQSAFLNSISWISIIVLAASFALLGVVIYRLQARTDAALQSDQQKLNEQANAVEHISSFIEAVSAGDYTVNLALEGDNSNLTTKLITMRDKLKENTESDRRRGWSTMGLAQIGEILRSTTTNSTELFDNIIRFIVKYTKSNQGGLFIINDEDDKSKPYLELIACYAFERKKYLTKRVETGEGLIGQCFLEGERIYLLDVPQEYISITSGLGGSRPKALLIVPMKLNGKIYGVIELASFNAFAEYEIELIEKLAETIASTISTVRVNESTRILLEQNLQQSEEMKAQEEELHQNMEELEATQEEMRRKQSILEKELLQSQQQADALKLQERKLTESQHTLQAIVDNIPRAIFWKDKDLYFMGCNKIFADVAGIKTPEEIIGKSDFDMAWSAQAEAYRKDDLEVMNSRTPKLNIEEVNVNSDGSESWVLTSKVPLANRRNEIVAILGMFEDITERKRKEVEVAQKLEERDEVLRELADLKRQLELKR